jgi:hypothetical protein
MRQSRKVSLLSLLLLSALALTACPNRTEIRKINADPDRYFNKEVGIAGTVTDSYGVPFVGGAYRLDDGTGKIWVVSERSVPSKGSRVGVKGRVLSGLTFGGRTLGTAVQESDRRVR